MIMRKGLFKVLASSLLGFFLLTCIFVNTFAAPSEYWYVETMPTICECSVDDSCYGQDHVYWDGYKVNHKLQKITIPAGSVVDTALDWYGPAKMAELYGTN